MDLTEIIFRLFAWVRPLLWYSHRLAHVLEAFLISLERPSVVERVRTDPDKRRQWAGILADLEHVLDIAVGLRTRELLGHRVEPEMRPGLRQQRIRVHVAPGFEALILRLIRLIDRYYDLERLACLRAARLRHEAAVTPVRLVADHRPRRAQPPLMMVVVSPLSQASSSIFVTLMAGQRIRAPPWVSPIQNQSPSRPAASACEKAKSRQKLHPSRLFTKQTFRWRKHGLDSLTRFATRPHT
jgi:hypothetical protein